MSVFRVFLYIWPIILGFSVVGILYGFDKLKDKEKRDGLIWTIGGIIIGLGYMFHSFFEKGLRSAMFYGGLATAFISGLLSAYFAFS